MNQPQLPRWEGYRTANHKYAQHLDAPDTPEFLYDLHSDPDELHNLPDDPIQATTLDELRAKCHWASQAFHGKSTPTPRPDCS